MDDDRPASRHDAATQLARESLDAYSRHELAARSELLRAEIARIEAHAARAAADRAAADGLFARKP